MPCTINQPITIYQRTGVVNLFFTLHPTYFPVRSFPPLTILFLFRFILSPIYSQSRVYPFHTETNPPRRQWNHPAAIPNRYTTIAIFALIKSKVLLFLGVLFLCSTYYTSHILRRLHPMTFRTLQNSNTFKLAFRYYFMLYAFSPLFHIISTQPLLLIHFHLLHS